MSTTTYIQLTPEQVDDMISKTVATTLQAKADQERAKSISAVTYYTASQAAKILGVTVETVRRWSREGLIDKKSAPTTEVYHIDDLERLRLSRNNVSKKP